MMKKEGRAARRKTATSAAKAEKPSLQRLHPCKQSTAGIGSSLHHGPAQHLGELRSGPSGGAESFPAGKPYFLHHNLVSAIVSSVDL